MKKDSDINDIRMSPSASNDSRWLKEYAKDSSLWADNVFQTEDNYYPPIIVWRYADIFKKGENEDIYGILLGIKDLFEVCLKIPVLGAL